MLYADDFNVLMIGNSYTSGIGAGNAGNPSVDLQGLFDADSQHSATVTQYSVGGGTLKGRVNDAAVTGPTGLIHNPTNDWDIIILQERSDRPGLAMKFGGSQLSGLDTGGPVLLAGHIKVSQPQAEVVLFNTWARFPGNQDLVDDFNNDPQEMLSFTNLGYDRIREKPGSWDHGDVTSIARVGDAWDQWYDTHGYASSSARLHRPDGSHQNDLGAYLAASVLFEQITGTSTIGNTYLGGVSGNIGDDSKVSLLQHQATALTGADVFTTADFNLDGDIDGSDYLQWQRGLSPDSLSETDLDNWIEQYGTSTPLSGLIASVPEPTSLLSALLAGSCVCVYRHRLFC